MTASAGRTLGRRVIVDTDTGIDDAVAVVLALAEPRLHVLAVTSVFGNASVEHTTENTLTLLDLIGARHVPVARGAAAGLIGRPTFAPQVHGENGVGDVEFPTSQRSAVPESAAQLIVRTVREESEPVAVVALGPLTNLALAFAIDPELPALIEEVIWMGGALAVSGNVTPVAEADALHDPEGADVVLASGCRVTIVGLDVTTRALLDVADLARMERSGTAGAQYLARILPYYFDFYERRLGVRECAMHSALTVAIAADPGLVRAEVGGPACIELSGTRTRGMLVVDRRTDLRAPWTEGRRDASVVLDADLPAFKARMLDLICGPGEPVDLR
jgi:inosine-uridine nucleoside N-ribohydrolase